MQTHFYHINLSWTRDRKGMLCSPELDSKGDPHCVEVATPPQFKNGVPGIWSPEHLFTAAVNSCLMTTFLSIAESSGLQFTSFASRATGVLGTTDGKMQMTEVKLEPVVKVPNPGDIVRAMKLIKKAEENCLISRSITARVVMHPKVELAESPQKLIDSALTVK